IKIKMAVTWMAVVPGNKFPRGPAALKLIFSRNPQASITISTGVVKQAVVPFCQLGMTDVIANFHIAKKAYFRPVENKGELTIDHQLFFWMIRSHSRPYQSPSGGQSLN